MRFKIIFHIICRAQCSGPSWPTENNESDGNKLALAWSCLLFTQTLHTFIVLFLLAVFSCFMFGRCLTSCILRTMRTIKCGTICKNTRKINSFQKTEFIIHMRYWMANSNFLSILFVLKIKIEPFSKAQNFISALGSLFNWIHVAWWLLLATYGKQKFTFAELKHILWYFSSLL